MGSMKNGIKKHKMAPETMNPALKELVRKSAVKVERRIGALMKDHDETISDYSKLQRKLERLMREEVRIIDRITQIESALRELDVTDEEFEYDSLFYTEMPDEEETD